VEAGRKNRRKVGKGDQTGFRRVFENEQSNLLETMAVHGGGNKMGSYQKGPVSVQWKEKIKN